MAKDGGKGVEKALNFLGWGLGVKERGVLGKRSEVGAGVGSWRVDVGCFKV